MSDMNKTRHYRNFRGAPTNKDDVTAPADRALFSNPVNHLRSRGNLTYLEFIRLVRHIWEDAHPDIPIMATSDDKLARYPVIVYGIEMRQTHTSDPKLRKRETIEYDGDNYVVMGQRFNNIISFTVITEGKPELAEEIIEVFESFMMEFTPIFKELGVSEIVYARRLPDTEQNRMGPGVTRRAVTYMVTLEKVFATSEDRLEQVSIDARTFLEEVRSENKHLNDEVKMNLGGKWDENSDEPRYNVGPGQYPEFTVEEDTNLPEPRNRIYAQDTAFHHGDLVVIAVDSGDLDPGYYMIVGRDGEFYDISPAKWERGDDGYLDLTTDNGDVTLNEGSGQIWHIPDTYVRTKITDEGADNPEWHASEPETQE